MHVDVVIVDNDWSLQLHDEATLDILSTLESKLKHHNSFIIDMNEKELHHGTKLHATLLFYAAFLGVCQKTLQ